MKPKPTNEEKHWYVLYTNGRWEKKVHLRLLESGVESYCPLNTVMRKWSDRLKKVEEPLFKSYVFVHISEPEKQTVLNTQGVVNFVYWLGKPAIVRDFEIEEIKRFLGEYENVEVVKLDSPIKPGTKLRVVSGLMMNHEATALKIYNKTIEVVIESIGFKLVATIDKKKLERI
jgi:transcription antitermination factor NusG